MLLRDIAKKDGRTVLIVSHDDRIREAADRVLWLEDGLFKDIGKLARDPVCGMAIEETSPSSIERDGRVYRFCSRGCQTEFADSPSRFVAESVQTP